MILVLTSKRISSSPVSSSHSTPSTFSKSSGNVDVGCDYEEYDEVIDWLDNTGNRLSEQELDSWDKDTLPAEFYDLAIRAENRYKQQADQETPACLSRVQKAVEDLFYYDWKQYSAIYNADFEAAFNYMEEYFAARQQAGYELEIFEQNNLEFLDPEFLRRFNF